MKQAWDIAKNTPNTVQGFKDVISQYGGQQTLEKGLEALNNSKIRGVLGKYGVDVDGVKSFGTSFLKENYKQNTSTNASNSLIDRLKKL